MAVQGGDGTNMGTAEALVDKDKKLFFTAAAVRRREAIKAYNFYRIQPGFWYDLDNNGWPDKPAGTCVPLLDGWDPGSETYVPLDGKPAAITNNVVWPATPTLYVGETLADAKMQAGETVGLPNVKDQCIVAKLWDEAGVRLFDPLKEWTTPVDLAAEIGARSRPTRRPAPGRTSGSGTSRRSSRGASPTTTSTRSSSSRGSTSRPPASRC